MQVDQVGEGLNVWLTDEEMIKLIMEGQVIGLGRPVLKEQVVVHHYNDLPEPANAAHFQAGVLTLNLAKLKLPAYIAPQNINYRPKDQRYPAGITVGAERERPA